MESVAKSLKALDGFIGGFLRRVSIYMLVAIFVLLTGNVFVRFVPVVSLAWFDEIIEMLFAWLVFCGAAALWREKEHFTVAFLPDYLKGKKTGYILDIVVNLVSLLFLILFTYYSLNLTIRATDWTPVLKMPKRLLYACMPVAGALMVIYGVRNILQSVCALREGNNKACR